MRKITLIFFSLSISLMLFSQKQSVQMDENGFSERSVYTTQGRLVRYFDSSDFYNSVTKINLELSPDIYLCKIVSEGKLYSSKLVIVE